MVVVILICHKNQHLNVNMIKLNLKGFSPFFFFFWFLLLFVLGIFQMVGIGIEVISYFYF